MKYNTGLTDYQRYQYFANICEWKIDFDIRGLIASTLETKYWHDNIILPPGTFRHLVTCKMVKVMFEDSTKLVTDKLTLPIIKETKYYDKDEYINQKSMKAFLNVIKKEKKSNKRLRKAFKKIIKEEYEFQVAEVKRLEKLKELKLKKMEERNKTCKKYTTMAAVPLKFLWATIVYTWDVLKSKKKGACPYVIFPTEKSSKK
jgi:hypothetical protein